MPITITTHSEATRRYLAKLSESFGRGDHLPVLKKTAWEAFAHIVSVTPKRYTGFTRQSWVVTEIPGRGYIVSNENKVMKFLEFGTTAHGPVTAKFLFIPLTREAAMGGWHPGLQFGVDYILKKRVRGIRATHIVQSERDRIGPILHDRMVAFVREAIR